MKFAIFGNTYQAKKSSHALRLFQLLRRQKAEVCMCRDFYQFLTAELKMDVHADYLFDGDNFTAENEAYFNSSVTTSICKMPLMPSTKLPFSNGTVLL